MDELLDAEGVAKVLKLEGPNRTRYWLERLSHLPKYKPAEYRLSDGPKAKRRWIASKLREIIYAPSSPANREAA